MHNVYLDIFSLQKSTPLLNFTNIGNCLFILFPLTSCLLGDTIVPTNLPFFPSILIRKSAPRNLRKTRQVETSFGKRRVKTNSRLCKSILNIFYNNIIIVHEQWFAALHLFLLSLSKQCNYRVPAVSESIQCQTRLFFPSFFFFFIMPTENSLFLIVFWWFYERVRKFMNFSRFFVFGKLDGSLREVDGAD